jgi:hypothetical protein
VEIKLEEKKFEFENKAENGKAFFFVIFCLGLIYHEPPSKCVCPSYDDVYFNSYLFVSDCLDCKEIIEIKKKIEEKYGMFFFFYYINFFSC